MEKPYQNKDWLYKMFFVESFSVSEIAQDCEVSITTISRWAEKFDIREIRQYSGDRKGPNNPYWKGGKYKDSQTGYIYIYLPEHSSANKKGYLPEHRAVMEDFLGRELKTNEVVRHKNKIKDDNRLENLELIVLGSVKGGAAVRCPYCKKRFKIN
ncbi:MAG: HNH endonuclease [Candidatus Pacebacteria bacterium]|nr:HNH endonuclease [Candidatus Paceibacterota bacterium]